MYVGYVLINCDLGAEESADYSQSPYGLCHGSSAPD